eukprot:m51a1_g8712 putative ras family gtpase (216) ;mRNA; r:129182-130411
MPPPTAWRAGPVGGSAVGTELSKAAVEYRIVVLGSGATGKSALTVQLCCHHFLELYDPTIEDSYRTQVEIDGRVAVLDILDTAGQGEYSALRDQYMRAGRGFLLIYAIDSRPSFQEIPAIRDRVYRVWDKDQSFYIPMTLCGNKSDLAKERKVNYDEGATLAAKWRADFFETSAKTRYNVEEAFFSVVRSIRKNTADDKPTGGKAQKNRTRCVLL